MALGQLAGDLCGFLTEGIDGGIIGGLGFLRSLGGIRDRHHPDRAASTRRRQGRLAITCRCGFGNLLAEQPEVLEITIPAVALADVQKRLNPFLSLRQCLAHLRKMAKGGSGRTFITGRSDKRLLGLVVVDASSEQVGTGLEVRRPHRLVHQGLYLVDRLINPLHQRLQCAAGLFHAINHVERDPLAQLGKAAFGLGTVGDPRPDQAGTLRHGRGHAGLDLLPERPHYRHQSIQFETGIAHGGELATGERHPHRLDAIGERQQLPVAGVEGIEQLGGGIVQLIEPESRIAGAHLLQLGGEAAQLLVRREGCPRLRRLADLLEEVRHGAATGLGGVGDLDVEIFDHIRQPLTTGARPLCGLGVGMPLLRGNAHIAAELGSLVQRTVRGLDAREGSPRAEGNQRTAQAEYLRDRGLHTTGHRLGTGDDAAAKAGEVVSGTFQLAAKLCSIEPQGGDQGTKYGHGGSLPKQRLDGKPGLFWCDGVGVFRGGVQTFVLKPIPRQPGIQFGDRQGHDLRDALV